MKVGCSTTVCSTKWSNALEVAHDGPLVPSGPDSLSRFGPESAYKQRETKLVRAVFLVFPDARMYTNTPMERVEGSATRAEEHDVITWMKTG